MGLSMLVSLVSMLSGTVLITFYIPASFAWHHVRFVPGTGVSSGRRERPARPQQTETEGVAGGGGASGRRIHTTPLFFYHFLQTSSSMWRQRRRDRDARVHAALITACFRVCGRVGFVSVRTPVRRCGLVRDSFLSLACLPVQRPSVPQTHVLLSVSASVCP